MLDATHNADDAAEEVHKHAKKCHDSKAALALRNFAAYKDRQSSILATQVEQETKDTDQAQQDVAFMDPVWAQQVRRIVDKYVENELLKERTCTVTMPQFQTVPHTFSTALFYDASIFPHVPASYRSDVPTPCPPEAVALAVDESQEMYASALARAVHSLHATPDSSAASGKARLVIPATHITEDATEVTSVEKISRMQYRKISKSEQETIDRIQKQRDSILEVYRRTGDVTHK